MRLLFNDDWHDDVKAVLAFLDGMATNQSDRRLSIDLSKIGAIVRGMRQDFPHRDGVDNASVFKKIANFVVYFIAEKPIQSEIITLTKMPEELAQIPNNVNTIVALLIAFSCLHNAPIHRRDGVEAKLSKKVRLSKHSLIDLVEALSSATPRDHFKIVAVLLEQIAYKTNPDCQYASEEW